MLLSVVIPAFNEEKIIAKTLENLKRVLEVCGLDQTDWELIVCDNNSNDQTAHIAAGSGARVVVEPYNQISRARNTGAAAANGEWLLFVDADTYPSEPLINEVLSLIHAGNHIGCGSTIELVDGTLFNKLRMERLNPIFRLFKLSGGAFILCERAAFEAIGGFSHDLFAYEEIDFVSRLKRHGRSKGKKFKVLHKHPVKTSGRKGDLSLPSLFRLVLSALMAPILFVLSYILPGKLIGRIGRSLLRYWYAGKR